MDFKKFRTYILHMRPMSWSVVFAHYMAGFLVSGQWSDSSTYGFVFLGALAWVPLLNGGTLALNSVFDKDEGNIGYLKNPPPLPRYLGLFSVALLVLGLILSLLINKSFAIAYGICFVLSILYSVPPTRFKAVAGVDLLINSTGYGALTFSAGWLSANPELSPILILTALGFFFLFAALYPLTQIYQADEDRRRGDRTLALIIGEKRSLVFAIVMAAVAFILFFSAAFRHGLNFGTVILGLGAVAWFGVLSHWRIAWSDYDHEQGMYRGLWCWALTDAGVILCLLM